MTNSLQHRNEVLIDRIGLQLASRLSGATVDLPYDITERLRAGRMQALAHRKTAPVQTARAVVPNGGAAALHWGDENLGLWNLIASFLPLLALVFGLVAINVLQSDYRAQELAEVDSALLTDDLPPTAYADPGFIQFLKSSQETVR